MFSQGQLIFAAIFFIAFVVLMVFSYKGDRKRNKKYFKNSYIVLIAFLIFIAFLFYMKIYFEK